MSKARPNNRRVFRNRPAIKYHSQFHNVIGSVMRDRSGWIKTTDGDDKKVDFFWVETLFMHEQFDNIYFAEHVKVNHFPRFYELTRKNLLAKNLKRFQKMMVNRTKHESNDCREAIENEMDFFPVTFELPDQWHMFVEEFKRKNGGNEKKKKSIWIMKPICKSQGKGIFLFKDLKDISDWKKGGKQKKETDEVEVYIVQRYIERPLLIGGKKFDMRMYVLVTSYVPLKAYVYREGFVRFSNTRFSTDRIEDSYVHLTNVAIQKKAPDYNPDRGAKWPLTSLRRYLCQTRGEDATEIAFKRVNDVFWYSLQAVQDKIINDKHCFELYGYDIMFDVDLKTWLIEVNASPSLSASSYNDKLLKKRMLTDTLNVIDLEQRLLGTETRVGGFDLLTSSSTCFLGCENTDREAQLNRIYREAASKLQKEEE